MFQSTKRPSTKKHDTGEIPNSNRNRSASAASSMHSNYTFYDENYKPMWNRGISRKIGESAFVQQTLPTYRLSWSPLKVCPILLIMGAFFTGMGFGIRKFSHNVKEKNIDYTHCISVENPQKTCFEVLENSTSIYNSSDGSNRSAIFHVDAKDVENCTCLVNFTLEEPFNGTVYIYYALQNFYQNHLHYYQSRDENQLKGNLFDKNGKPKEPSSLCDPYDYDNLKRIIYPCGLMANSMFTDVIDLYYYPPKNQDEVSKVKKKFRNFRFHENEANNIKPSTVGQNEEVIWNMTVPVIRTGIAWESDKEDKFQNPEEFDDYGENHTVWQNFTKPWGWKKSLWELDPTNSSNNGVLNEDFIVWMRTAAFPWFRKLYRIVDTKVVPFHKGLPAGNYSLLIQYNYDVSQFDGGKEIILTTSKMLAGKNMFLAIAYMATGGICIFLSIVLFIVYKCSGSMRFSIDELKND